MVIRIGSIAFDRQVTLAGAALFERHDGLPHGKARGDLLPLDRLLLSRITNLGASVVMANVDYGTACFYEAVFYAAICS